MPHSSATFGLLSVPEGLARSGSPLTRCSRTTPATATRMGVVELKACPLGLLIIDARKHDITALVLNQFLLGQPHCHLGRVSKCGTP